MNINKIIYHIKNIFRYGALYEIHWIQRKLGLIYVQPWEDRIKQEKYWRKRPKQYEKGAKEQYKVIMGVELNLGCPQTFTEKINRMKLYDSTDLKANLADKYLVRKWIEEKLGKDYLIPVYGVWSSFDEINFDTLPDSFVLKCNHGSGMNLVVKDKKQLDLAEAKKQFDLWMKCSFAYVGFELHYDKIDRKIIAEKYIEELNGKLFDYKVHCFHGVPRFIQVIGDRDLAKHKGFQKNYDFDWNEWDWTFADYPDFPYVVPRPHILNELKRCAEILSSPFEYVRIDFYILNDRVLFGEMTFTPGAGFYKYRDRWTYDRDKELGSWI